MINKSKAIGGDARAKALSAEERKKIAQKAASARWNKDILKATHTGELKIGDIIIECAVLEDGTRVLSQTSVDKALGRSKPSSKKRRPSLEDSDGILPSFLGTANIKPFISNELMQPATNPILFVGFNGQRSLGFKAEILPEICNVWLSARDANALHPSQKNIAIKADMLMRGLAIIGIISLIDEATGYQEVRDRAALQKILDKYITDEWAKWTKTFPDDFYKELFRLKGINFSAESAQKPMYVGHWTNDIIYDRLAPGVKDTLKKKNPRQLSTGGRKHKHFQFLTKDYGHPELKELLSNAIFMMKACSTWEQFKELFNKVKPKYGNTIEMDV